MHLAVILKLLCIIYKYNISIFQEQIKAHKSILFISDNNNIERQECPKRLNQQAHLRVESYWVK